MRLFIFPRAADFIRISQVNLFVEMSASECNITGIQLPCTYMASIWLCLFGVCFLDPVEDMLISTTNSQYLFHV